jgi:gamma-glutamylaminecyclotransferase
MHHVFVYGTLKRGFPNHHAAMAHISYVGRFRTVIAFPLVIGGKSFSPYLIDEPGEGQRVFGEVFKAGDDGLLMLDRMEGTHLPNGYRRIIVGVEDSSGDCRLDVWTYVKDRQSIEIIHSNSMDEYQLDPRYVVPSQRTRVF